MTMIRKMKRKTLWQISVALASTLGGSSVGQAATALYDSLTPRETGVSGAGLVYTGGAADEFMGNGLLLAPGANDITGFDCYVLNASGMNMSGIRLNIYVWGAANLSTINSSNPAFSNLLASYSLTDSGNALPTGYYSRYESSPTGSPGITLGSPLALPTNTIGLTFNYQGTTDGVNYSSIPGLTSYIAYGAPATVGSNARGSSSFDLAVQGETNGNFISGPYAFPAANYSNQAYAARVYGDVVSTVPNNWLNSAGGSWTDSTQWSTAAIPTGGSDAVFNLSSSGYTVTVSDAVLANNLVVKNDHTTFDLNGLNSQISVLHGLSVGASNGTTGSLNLANSGLLTDDQGDAVIPFIEAGSITVGANGGLGSVTISALTLLYSDGDTAIGAGSSISVAKFGKLATRTLTIAGSSTTGWTGKLDINDSHLNIRNGSIGTVISQLKSGYANGAWNGQGITSSAAAADTSHLTAIGAILNNDGAGNKLYGTGTALGLFDGDNPAVTAVLLKYTYVGDANLDGKVDGSDYSRIDFGFINHASGWYNGDFNYDGVVNGSDYTLLDNVYNTQTNGTFSANAMGVNDPNLAMARLSTRLDNAHNSISFQGQAITERADIPDPLASVNSEIASPTSVPEPASFGLSALLATALLGRRTKKHSSKNI